MTNLKQHVIDELNKAIDPFLGEGITSNMLGVIGSTVTNILSKFVNDGTLDHEKWKHDNTIIVTEKNCHEVDIILPGWIHEWLENEED